MLIDKIKEDRISAMKAKDKAKVDTLRMLIASLENTQIELGKSLSDLEVEQVIYKQLKNLDKEILAYKSANKGIEKQELEKEILNSYLPKQMTEEEIANYVNSQKGKIIAIGNMGKAIKEVSGKLGSTASTALIAKYVKQALSEVK